MFQYWADDQRESVVFSFHLVWLFYEAVQGGADTNELFYAARKIRAGNNEDWATGSRRLPMKPPMLAMT
jgi:hypothetical protein